MLTFLVLWSCKSTTKQRGQNLPPPAPPSPHSNAIKTLLPVESHYENHFWIDLNGDTRQELMIVSKSAKRSKCLTSRDTNCYFLDISFHTSGPNRPELISKHSLPNFTKTQVALDSLERIWVTTRFKPTGHSLQYQTNIYSLRDGTFYLEHISLDVDTKISSAFGPNEDNWEYIINPMKGDLKVKYSQIREDTAQIKRDLVVKDTTYKSTFPPKSNIMLGTAFRLDSLIGERNMIHYY